jgi:hypothetical protein
LGWTPVEDKQDFVEQALKIYAPRKDEQAAPEADGNATQAHEREADPTPKTSAANS